MAAIALAAGVVAVLLPYRLTQFEACLETWVGIVCLIGAVLALLTGGVALLIFRLRGGKLPSRHLPKRLIYLAFVLAIPALLLVIRPQFHFGGGRFESTRIHIQSISVALDLYQTDVGACPTSGQGLDALVTNPGLPNWKGPYLKDPYLTWISPDAWGTPLRYSLVGRTYEIRSAGPDGTFGTPDDLTN